jgi:N-methylhydantoinase A
VAWGVHDVVNEDIARAFRIHAAERGIDFRRAAMVASGGGGPIHATGVARKLEIPRVIVPLGAGAMSALGLLSAPVSFETALSHPVRLDELAAETFREIMGGMIETVLGELAAAGVPRAEVTLEGWLDMRFAGQGYEIECALGRLDEPDALFPALRERFLEAYRAIFGEVVLDEPLEVIAWKVEGRGPRPSLPAGGLAGAAAEVALKGHRPCWVPEEDAARPVPVYDRYALAPGETVTGPALVEERESTCLLRRGDRAAADAEGALAIEIAAGAPAGSRAAAGGGEGVAG